MTPQTMRRALGLFVIAAAVLLGTMVVKLALVVS